MSGSVCSGTADIAHGVYVSIGGDVVVVSASVETALAVDAVEQFGG